MIAFVGDLLGVVPSVGHDADLGAEHVCFLHAVGGQDDAPIGLHLIQNVPQLASALWVEPTAGEREQR